MSDEPIKNCMHYEINDVKEHLSPITRLNLKIAGALANVNRLIDAGGSTRRMCGRATRSIV